MESKKPRRFVIRTIKNGRVKIFDRYFYPAEKYNGELDGQRWAFALYWNMVDGHWVAETAYLWGTEELYRAKTEAEVDQHFYNQPNLIKGEYYWTFWKSK